MEAVSDGAVAEQFAQTVADTGAASDGWGKALGCGARVEKAMATNGHDGETHHPSFNAIL